MARSDSPQAPPGGWPAQRPQGEYDLAGWTQNLGGAPVPNPKPQQQPAPAQAHAQQPAYGTQPAPQGYSHQDQGYQWGADPRAPQVPHFDPYVPPTQPSRRPAPDPFALAQPANPYPAQPNPAYSNGYNYQPEAAPAPSPPLRGAQYDQWAAASAPAPSADPRGYDLASYMPPQSRTQPPQPAPNYGHLTADLATHPQSGYSDWGHQSGFQPAPQGGYSGQNGYEGYDQQSYAEPQTYDETDYDPEPPQRSRKWLTIAGALVGAVVVGGGLTYGYQTVFGDTTNGPTPVVKSAEGPSKVKPSEPGGKQFANTDSKLLGRLGEGDSSASPSESEGSGARKVQTLVVGRDGAIQAPSSATPPPSADEGAPGVSVPVPGMTLIDVPTPGAPAAAPVAQRPQPIVVQPPPQEVQVASNEQRPAPVLPKSLNTTSEAAPAPVAEKPKPAPKPVTKTAAIPDSASSPAPAPKVSGLGYVAVLASVPVSGTSRIDALQQFADLQQRYGGILQNKTPDVTEANLGEKGRYHRLVVGPPGSKDGANSVCSQLKTAGYASCWVMAY